MRRLGLIALMLLALSGMGDAHDGIQYDSPQTQAIEFYPYFTTALTSGAATSLFTQSVPVGAFVHGSVYVRVICTDGTDFVTGGWDVPYTCTNKAGTEICSVGAEATSVAATGGASFGALSLALSYTGTNVWSLQVNVTCSLAETTLAARWRIVTFGDNAVTPIP